MQIYRKAYFESRPDRSSKSLALQPLMRRKAFYFGVGLGLKLRWGQHGDKELIGMPTTNPQLSTPPVLVSLKAPEQISFYTYIKFPEGATWMPTIATLTKGKKEVEFELV